MRCPLLLSCFISLALVCPVPGQSQSLVTTLTFDTLLEGESVLGYYYDGFGDLNSGPGPKYGITFGPDSQVVTSKLAPGGHGNFQNEPSPNNILFFLSGTGDVMNVAGGFTNGFSFYYSSVSLSGAVTVWSGTNGTGDLLATIDLPALGSLPGLPTDNNIWAPVGVSFNGVAQSVNFGGTPNNIGFDNITLGASVPTGGVTPAPSSLVTAALAVVAGGVLTRGRRKSTPLS